MVNVIMSLCTAAPETRAAILGLLSQLFGRNGEAKFHTVVDATTAVVGEAEADEAIEIVRPLLEALVPHAPNGTKEGALCALLVKQAHEANKQRVHSSTNGDVLDLVIAFAAIAADMDETGILSADVSKGLENDHELRTRFLEIE